MCDELTDLDSDIASSVVGLSRREFATMTAASLAAVYPAASLAAGLSLTEAMVGVPTPDGTCDAFFVHPAKGKFPGIILWPDIGGLREAKKVLARRLAAAGYAVLAVNHYYRSAKAPVLASFAEWRTPEGRAKIAPMGALLNPETTARDARAFVAFLDKQKAVNTRRGIGNQGYCMTGSYAVRATAASPRIKAAASFHGGGLATDRPDSPHLVMGQSRASFLVAVARNDDARNPSEKETVRAAAAAARRPVEITVYAADHGWCVPDSPVYNQAEADRAHSRLLALYARL